MNNLVNKSITDIEAITLDLDDTLWPVAPTIAGAEQDLFDWLCAHAPKTADLTRQSGVKQAIRQEVIAQHQARSHDLGFLRREMIRESLRLTLMRLFARMRWVSQSQLPKFTMPTRHIWV